MRAPVLALASMLALSLLGGPRAAAQMCTFDAGCDAGADAGMSDGGPGDGGLSDGGPSDAGMSLDASLGDGGARDAGQTDAGTSGPSVAACSCETALDSDGLIHVCTGSFDRDVCRSFACDQGTVRSERCPASAVGLCCTMTARRLYSQLYEDCSHANCESGFRAQCQEFGGAVTLGACEAPDLPDDPDTETGDAGSCSMGQRSGEGGSALAFVVLSWAIVRLRRRRA